MSSASSLINVFDFDSFDENETRLCLNEFEFSEFEFFELEFFELEFSELCVLMFAADISSSRFSFSL